GCAMSITRITEDRPAIAPTSTAVLSHARLASGLARIASSIAVATGLAVSSSRYGAMPTSTAHTAMEIRAQATSEPTLQMGMSRCGVFASPDAVETASQPPEATGTMVG